MTNTGERVAPVSGPAILWQELKSRTKLPATHFTFWVYFLLAVCGLGASGIWVEALGTFIGNTGSNWTTIYTALLTFSPAIVGPAALQTMFEEDKNRRMRAFASAAMALAVIGVVVLGMVRERAQFEVVFVLAIALALVSSLIWWVLSSNNVGLRDEPEPDAPVGGDVDKELDGSLDDFRT